MKIIIVGPAFPWRGGIAHHSALLAEHLSKRHDVQMVTFSRQYPKILFPGKTQIDVGGTPPPVPINQWIDSVNPITWFTTAGKIKALKPDLVIFAYSLPFFAPEYGIIARKVRSSTTKIMYLCHNIVPHEHTIIDTTLTKFAFAVSDFFMVQSSIVESELLKIVPEAKYTISPHPIYEMFGASIPQEEAKNMLGIPLTTNILLFFGYVREYKGLMVLVEAMDKLKKSGFRMDNFKLLVVGEFYENEQTYRQKIKELNLESDIIIKSDYAPKEEVARYFSAADAVVLPYRSASQSGIAQIAYNFDKPAIVTNVGGLAEVVVEGKTGFIVPPENPSALADAIRKFYDGNHKNEFIPHVREEKQKYTWDHFIRKLETLVGYK